MQTFAHIVDGAVYEVLSVPDGMTIGKDLYSSEIAAASVPCDDTVTAGMIYDPGKKNFSAGPTIAGKNSQYEFLSFLSLFTQSEQTAIVGSDDVRVRLFCLMAAGASFVDLTDPRVVQGTQLLEMLGLIAKGRAAKVLAGQAPSAS